MLDIIKKTQLKQDIKDKKCIFWMTPSSHLFLLWSTHLSCTESDPWWTFCVTNRAPCSRETGITPPCWPPPHPTAAHPKTCTPPSCSWKTTAVSDRAARVEANAFACLWRWKHKATVSHSGYTSLRIRLAHCVLSDREGNYHCCSPGFQISLQTQ